MRRRPRRCRRSSSSSTAARALLQRPPRPGTRSTTAPPRAPWARLRRWRGLLAAAAAAPPPCNFRRSVARLVASKSRTLSSTAEVTTALRGGGDNPLGSPASSAGRPRGRRRGALPRPWPRVPVGRTLRHTPLLPRRRANGFGPRRTALRREEATRSRARGHPVGDCCPPRHRRVAVAAPVATAAAAAATRPTTARMRWHLQRCAPQPRWPPTPSHRSRSSPGGLHAPPRAAPLRRLLRPP